MNRNIIIRIFFAVTLISLCFISVACTTSIKNPSITDEKARLTGVRIQAENKTWHEADAEDAEKLFKLVKGLGDLPTEPIEIGLSGKYSYEVTYDYSFEISYETGNFFHKKKSCFTYNLGELRVRKNADGTEKTAYFENKLVVRKPLIKYISTLSDEKCQIIIDICEAVNTEIMAAAFENVADNARGKGYSVEEIPKSELASAVFNDCGALANGDKTGVLRGYKISAEKEHYVFLANSSEWAEKMEELTDVKRVGRVFFKWKDGYSDEIRNVLMS